MIAFAKLYLRLERARNTAFPDLKHGSAQWMMLVDLWVVAMTTRPISVTSVIHAAGVPGSTGLRHVGLLVERGYLVTEEDANDARRSLLRFTAAGLAKVGAQLAREYAAWSKGWTDSSAG